MKTKTIRAEFLKFFEQHKHTVVPSSPLTPADDPTLLFTNAGMVQFKDVFLGKDIRPYQRAASVQCCIRAGGKHNDLENVGYTARHHTFFEMLGNFSFGDYFKREAIHFAWDFLTKVLKLPPAKLWITVFEDDVEAENIWINEIGVDPTRFSRCGEKDNFWAMGDTGPCGPCSEIFYDHGAHIPGGPPGSPDADLDRYVEIWNLVFMQYERNAKGELTPLPKPSVDTGMGLERVAAVMQGVHENYDIDLFKALIAAIIDITGCTDPKNRSLRVLADHIRSTAFLIKEGIRPSNEGRGYVLRRIIRRAVRHGTSLGMHQPFFYRITKPLIEQMGEAYPDLAKAQETIEKVLLQEEEQFARTLQQGLNILDATLPTLKDHEIPGDIVFRLYDTYGFPVDLTADIAREKNFTLDMPGFEACMEKQRALSAQASHFGRAQEYISNEKTEFTGYHTTTEQTHITGIYVEGHPQTVLEAGQMAAVVLARTPFYAQAGGQIGDEGVLKTPTSLFKVIETTRSGQATIHQGMMVAGQFKMGDTLNAEVDVEKRLATARNHSATHLLHAALRQILGDHVVQKGSLVAPDRLRFDFTHFSPLTAEESQAVETLVNQKIRDNSATQIKLMKTSEALAQGAMALFGEKYGEEVRVLEMGDGFSVELCGGTHVVRTGDIGVFKILTESGVASGVRRIEAVTGAGALAWFNQNELLLQQMMTLLKSPRQEALGKLEQLVAKNRELEKSLAKLTKEWTQGAPQSLGDLAVEVHGIKVIAQKLPDADTQILRQHMDALKSQFPRMVACLASVTDGRISLIAGVSKSCLDRFSAVDLVNFVAHQVGGKGGGRPDLAQAGGDNIMDLDKALESVIAWVEKK